ncbi:hypothetical protein K8R62_00495 [bacterium]|nr:hypothetical protein [bacterium]
MKKKRKVDYSKKTLKNPFRRKTKKKIKQDRVKSLKIIFIFLISITSISFLTWFFILSNFWTLEKIEVSGLLRVDENEIKEIVYKKSEGKKYFIIPASNILFIKKKGIKNDIKEKYHFKNIEILSNWPDMISVKVEENECSYILKQTESYYEIDSNNFIISKIDKKNEKFGKITLIENKNENIISKDKVNIDFDYINYIKKIDLLMRQKEDDFKIIQYIIDEENKNNDLVKAKIKNGPLAYFNTKNKPENQFKKLILVKDELGDDFWNKIYINLEFGDKVFYQ